MRRLRCRDQGLLYRGIGRRGAAFLGNDLWHKVGILEVIHALWTCKGRFDEPVVCQYLLYAKSSARFELQDPFDQVARICNSRQSM